MEKNKIFLKVGLILYIVTTVLSLFAKVDIAVIKEIVKLRQIYIPITSILLIAYAWDKGAEGIGKLAVASICGIILFDIITAYNIIPNLFLSNSSNIDVLDIYKIVSGTVYVLDRIFWFGLNLCTMLALFSILPTSKSSNSSLQLVAVLFLIGATILNIIYYFSDNNSILSTLVSVFESASNISEYLVVGLYLLSRGVIIENKNNEENKNTETPLNTETTITIQNNTQQTPKQLFEIRNDAQPQVQRFTQQQPQTQPVTQPMTQPVLQPTAQINNTQ